MSGINVSAGPALVRLCGIYRTECGPVPSYFRIGRVYGHPGVHAESGIESATADRDALPVLTRIVPAEVFSVRYGYFYR